MAHHSYCRFFYSIGTFVVLFIFGVLTFLDAPGIAKNQPTPLIGLWERINIGVFLLWVVVLGIVLLRVQEDKPQESDLVRRVLKIA